MKKKRLFILLSSVAIIGVIGGTYAAFVASSDPIEKTVSAASLGIDIDQQIGAVSPGEVQETEDGVIFSGGVPGMEIPDVVTVKNTENQDAYIRVTIYKSWMTGGEKASEEDGLDVDEIDIVCPNDDWIFVQPNDDQEVLYFYYKEPVKAGESSTPVMESFTILADSLAANSNNYAGKGVKIEFEADGIQTIAARDAMLAEWGVNAAFSGDTLVSVEEQ